MAILKHLQENPIPTLDGALGLAEGMIIVGALRKCSEIRHLLEREIVQRLAEIVEGCRGHAVGVHPQEDFVQVELHNLVFGETLLDPLGEYCFLELAFDRTFGIQKEVLGDLLSDRRGADNLSLARQFHFRITNGRRGNTLPVEPRMRVEVLVLG